MENISVVNWDAKTIAIVACSGILVIFGLYKVITQGIKLLFWVCLVILGTFGIGYMLQPDFSSIVVSKFQSGDIKDLIPKEQLRTLCEQLNKIDSEQATE